MNERPHAPKRILIKGARVHMAHSNGRVCGAKRPKCEAERSLHL